MMDNDVTGVTAAIFHAGTAARQRYQGLMSWAPDDSGASLAATCRRRPGLDRGSGHGIQGALNVPVSKRIAVQSSPAQIALILPPFRRKTSSASHWTLRPVAGIPSRAPSC